MDGWYLATSAEHYRTHLCHIKDTRSERFTDTVHFSHKNITNPNVTHADKIMAAIAECAKAIKTMGSDNGADEMTQLQRLTEKAVATDTEVASKLLRPVEKTRSAIQEAPSIKKSEQEPLDPNQRITRSMKAPKQQDPRVPTAASPRAEKQIVIAEQACKKKAKQRRKRRELTRSHAGCEEKGGHKSRNQCKACSQGYT